MLFNMMSPHYKYIIIYIYVFLFLKLFVYFANCREYLNLVGCDLVHSRTTNKTINTPRNYATKIEIYLFKNISYLYIHQLDRPKNIEYFKKWVYFII